MEIICRNFISSQKGFLARSRQKCFPFDCWRVKFSLLKASSVLNKLWCSDDASYQQTLCNYSKTLINSKALDVLSTSANTFYSSFMMCFENSFEHASCCSKQTQNAINYHLSQLFELQALSSPLFTESKNSITAKSEMFHRKLHFIVWW